MQLKKGITSIVRLSKEYILLIPIFYWLLLTVLTLFTFKKILKQQEKKISLIRRFILLFNFFYLRIYFPLVASMILYFFVFICGLYILYVINSICLTINYPKESINIPIVTYEYITMTITSIVYAHTNRFKLIYSGLLKYLSFIYSVPYGFDTIESEKDKVSKDLLRLHVYILLALIYFTVNVLNFSAVFDKNQVSFITESLLTFVIVDTAIVINRDLKNKQIFS